MQDGESTYPAYSPVCRLPPDLLENTVFLLKRYRRGKLHASLLDTVLQTVGWLSANAHGKGDRCPYWSEKAKKARASWSGDDGWRRTGNLHHEHVVPKKYIMNRLLELRTPTIDNVGSALAYSFYCVVHRNEHSRFVKGTKQNMPAGWKWGDDVWARYRLAGIRVVAAARMPAGT